MAQEQVQAPDVTQTQEEQAPPPPQEQEQDDKQAEAIKFIKQSLETPFDEQDAKKLFEYYTLDDATQRLQPPDVRKLLLDILSASEWPLVVPDESLDAVLHELCLNDEGSISWIEFKSFFVFLQDKPLMKLFQIITKLFTHKQILLSRLVTIKPLAVDGAKDDEKVNVEQSEQNYYDRNKWKSAVQSLIPEAQQIFIYFMDGYQILALAIGAFDSVLAEPAAAEVKLDDITYLASIRAFNDAQDMFPPIARSGGLKSKVARKIADSYLIARQWDQKHFKLVDKTINLAHNVSVKWTQFDEKYKVNERVNATATSVIDSVKAFDEKHQLTRRLSNSAKQINEKLGITDKLEAVADKVKQNDKVQLVSNKVNESIKTAVQTVDDIGHETQQLVQEKRQQNQPNVASNQGEEPQNEGDP
eukprot:593088_1